MNRHREDEDANEEEFGSRTTHVTPNTEGNNGDRKTNTNRSKHSETEQRRRSKINERFQILRELIPENDQKRDKATFLLEVIQYIQFLQERVRMFEEAYQGWGSDPTKLTPWKNSCGGVESFVDQSHLVRNEHGNSVVAPAILTSTPNSIDSDFGCEAMYRATDHGAATEALNLGMPLATNLVEGETAEPPHASFSNTEDFTSQSQHQLWHARPNTAEYTTTNYTPDEPEGLKNINMGVTDSCSHGLLNTLTQALQTSGVDLSQTSISVELDIAKHADRGMTSMAFSSKENKNLSSSNQASLHCGVGGSGEDSAQAHKRLRTEQSK